MYSSSLLKVKEDDEVDNLDIKLDVRRKTKRVYQSSAPEVNLKISRSLKVSQPLFPIYFKICPCRNCSISNHLDRS